MRTVERSKRASGALLIYILVLVSLMVFLITVSAEAFLADEEGLAWATAAVAVVTAGAVAAFYSHFRP